MSTLNDSAYNVTTLAALTGMPKTTAAAWIRCEGQGTPNPTNPLNIRYWGYSTQLLGPGADGTAGVGFARYSSALAGLTDAARMIATSGNYTGIRNAIATRDAVKVAQAIEASPWAGGNYGGGAGKAGCIVRGVNGGAAPSSGGSAIPAVSAVSATYTTDQWNAMIACLPPGTRYLSATNVDKLRSCAAAQGIDLTGIDLAKLYGKTISDVRAAAEAKGLIGPTELVPGLGAFLDFGWVPGFAVNAGVLVLVALLGYKGFERMLD